MRTCRALSGPLGVVFVGDSIAAEYLYGLDRR